MRRGKSSTRGFVDLEVIDGIIARNSLWQIGMSRAMFGGNCPFCGFEKSFIMWRESGLYRCFYCGCDGRFVRSPEREMERMRRESEARDKAPVVA